MKLFKSRIKGVSVIVPTKNSETRISPLLTWLTDKFDEVVVGIDEKTTDETRKLVENQRCKLIETRTDGGYVEEVLGTFWKHCKYDWVLRLDDDEFVSSGLVKFLERDLSGLRVGAVGIHRKWCCFDEKKDVKWSCYPAYGFDWQYRLFNKNIVSLNTEIHTPGIKYDSFTYSPLDSYIVHLDWILKNYQQRKDKVERYEAIKKGEGHREYYLYEDIPQGDNYLVDLIDINIKRYISVNFGRRWAE
jgi:glycosyltransferase involved in cell wall biosynthesis